MIREVVEIIQKDKEIVVVKESQMKENQTRPIFGGNKKIVKSQLTCIKRKNRKKQKIDKTKYIGSGQ